MGKTLPGILSVLIIGAASVGGFMWWQNNGIAERSPSDDLPEPIRIPGGMLEVVTLRLPRPFILNKPTEVVWHKFELCPETARINLDAYFTYRVRLAETFPATASDGTLHVQVPKLEPSLPVAWDTKTLQKSIDKCWLMPGRNTMEDLEHDISRQLEQTAKQPSLINYAESNGARETVKEFVRTWLQKQTKYRNLPRDIPIEITFG